MKGIAMKLLFVLFAIVQLSYGAINKYWHVASDGTGNTTEGTTWATAINCDSLMHILVNDVVAGDVFYIKSGTYTPSGSIDFSARDGSAISPIAFIGIKATTTNEGSAIDSTDWAHTTERPLLALGTNNYLTSDYCRTRNISIQGTTANNYYCGSYNTVICCKFDNNYGSAAARYGLRTSTGCIVIGCEFVSSGGYGSGLNTGGSNRVLFNYFHDMVDGTAGVGVNVGSTVNTIAFNKFVKCRIGITSAAQSNSTYINNTFFACTTSINATTDYGVCVINNILDSSKTDGMKWGTQTDANIYMKNHGADARNNDMWDGVDESTCFKDYSATTGDPLFTNSGSYDFSLQAGSPCLNTGIEAP